MSVQSNVQKRYFYIQPIRLTVLNFLYQILYLTTSRIVCTYQSHKDRIELPEVNQVIKTNIGENELYFCMSKLQFSPKVSDNIKILRCEVFHPATHYCVEQAFQFKLAGELYYFIIVCYLLEFSLNLGTSSQIFKLLLVWLDNGVRHPKKLLEALESYLKEIISLRKYFYMSE